MGYGTYKCTPLARKRLAIKVARQAAKDKVAAEAEPQDAMGTIMTQIDCPECQNVFDMEGDREGETIQCPDCKHHLKVRRL